MPNPDKPRHRPSVPEIMPVVQAFYNFHCAGGCLHIVLDDGNIADDDVAFCVQFAEERGEHEQAQLARLILMMTPTQRRKLYRRSGITWDQPPRAHFEAHPLLSALCEKYQLL